MKELTKTQEMMIVELTGLTFSELEEDLFDDLSDTDEKLNIADTIKKLNIEDYNLIICYTFIPSYRKLAVLFDTTRFKINKQINIIQAKLKSRI